ncbi:MAG: septum formation initiator family protein [Actinomycetota bacterium]
MSARAYAGTRAAPRRRPAARRRPARRRGSSRVNWDRLGRVALTIVLAAVLVSYLNPVVNFIHTYRDSGAAKEHLRELQLENRHMHNRVQSADDPGVLEREARRQGMVEPGERPYVVKGLGK